MTKKRSISLFAIFSIILVICLIACFVNFTYPFSINGNYYSYSNFVSNIKTGEDVSSSLRITYRAELPQDEIITNYNNLRSNAMDRLQQIVQDEGFKDVTVSEYGDDGIVIQVGNLLTEADSNSLIALIGNPQTISFSTNSDGSDPFVKAECVKSATANSYSNQGEVSYYVLIEFKDEYKAEMAAKSADNTIYVYLGDTEFISGGLSAGSIDENGMISLSNPDFKSLLDATTVANQIKTGMLGIELTQTSCNTISASYGNGADILLSIALVAIVLAACIYLIVKFKDMGWLTTFAMMFFVTISLFLLQSIPFAHLNFAGFIALAICFLVAVDTVMIVLQAAKKHYQEDSKLHIAFKMAFKETMARTFINNSLFALVGLLCIFMPVLSVQSFGWVALVLPFVSIFTTQALMRLFVKMYLAINNENGKKCNFHKGGKNA